MRCDCDFKSLKDENLPASESKQNSGRNTAAGSMKETVPVAEAGREHKGNTGRHRRECGCQRLKAEQLGKERTMKREAPVTGQRKVRLFLLLSDVHRAAGCPSSHQLKHITLWWNKHTHTGGGELAAATAAPLAKKLIKLILSVCVCVYSAVRWLAVIIWCTAEAQHSLVAERKRWGEACSSSSSGKNLVVVFAILCSE